jgi:osmotically inducible protein OsmC
MKINRSGSAVWSGGLKDGGGTLSTQSGVLTEQPYGFGSRFENGRGTNPEELIGAAHAGCFTMALSLILGNAGFKAERMETTSVITLEQVGEGFSITRAALTLRAKIPGIDAAKFQELAHTAETNCPVSKLFKAQITLDAQLV